VLVRASGLCAIARASCVDDSPPSCSGSKFLGRGGSVCDIKGSEVDSDAIAGSMARVLVTTGADLFGADPVKGEILMGSSITLNGMSRPGRFRRRINKITNAMAIANPPTTPPAIAGAFDLWEDITVEEGGDVVGVETINSGLMVIVEKDPVGKGAVEVARFTDIIVVFGECAV